MKDYYTEILLERAPAGKDKALFYVFTALAAGGLLVMPVLPPGLIGAAAFGWLAKVMHGRTHTEYEYLFVNGDMDIDTIINKRKRKHLLSCRAEDVEILAPEGHEKLKPFEKCKKYDYSTRRADRKRFVLVVRQGSETAWIVFEPDQTVVEGFEMRIPRKVVRK